MELKIAISEVHDELLNSSNTLKLQSLANEFGFSVNFIKGKINQRILQNYHVLIIGGPTLPLDYSEILDIEQFVEYGGYLLIFSIAGGDIDNKNLSHLSRKFEFEFNPDFVEDHKHNINNNPRIPIVHYIKKNFSITKNINKIAFTGCSMTPLDDKVHGFLFTDKDSIPFMTPLGVISSEKNVIGISSSSIFNDTLIDKFDNKKLLINIFKFIISIFKIREKQLRSKYKNISVPKALKLIEHLISINSKSLNSIDTLIDNMWKRINDLIPNQTSNYIKNNLNKSYTVILHKIDQLALQVSKKYSEFTFLGNEFQNKAQSLLNLWYEQEAEKREKLDMIRNNLLAKINNV